MVKNKIGGNKAKKNKNSTDRTAGRPLVIKKADDELYGKIIKRLGGEPPIIEVLCSDMETRRCVIRGKMKKRVWMNPDDVVLIKYHLDMVSNPNDKNSKQTSIENRKGVVAKPIYRRCLRGRDVYIDGISLNCCGEFRTHCMTAMAPQL